MAGRLVALWGVLVLAASSAAADGHITPAARQPSAGKVAARGGATSHAARARVLTAYGRLPLSYEPNRGQFDGRVAFVARAGASAIALTGDGALLRVARSPRAGRGGYSTLGLGFVGARRELWPVASDRLAGRVNYLIGNERSRWHTNIPTYARTVYRRAWPGIDVSFSGVQRQIEYAFMLAPHADPGRIVVRLSGARSLRITPDGDLLVRLRGGGVVRELAPRSYQTSRAQRRVGVSSRYRLAPHNIVRIALGPYDHAHRLTIDPSITLGYSTYLGGSNADTGFGIAVDGHGAAYVTGETLSADFPTTTATFQTANAGNYDAFVTKLDAAGTAVAYSTYLGGSSEDHGFGIAIDGQGAAYITGSTASTNFPATVGAFQTTNGGDFDAFVTKLDAAGSALVYSTYLGGNGRDIGQGIAIGGLGTVYVTGSTLSSSFPTTSGALQTSAGGGGDAFVTKVNATGTALPYSTYLGGSGGDSGAGIAVDGLGAAYITGNTSGSFPATIGAFQTAAGGGEDAFVTKLNATGTALAYSTYLGGSGTEFGFGIGVDTQGAAYATGDTNSADFPTTAGALQATRGSLFDGFVTKLSTSGTAAVYSTYLGGNGDDAVHGIAIDGQGAAYLTGFTDSTDFPTTTGALQTTLSGSTDAFVTKLNATGAAPEYSTYLGGNNLEQGNGIAVDGQGAAYVTGVTGSSDFPTTTAAFQTTLSGGTDAFVTKIVSGGAAPPHPTSTSVACAPGSVTVGGSSTCSVTVTDTSASGAGTPTGSVTVMISGPAGGSLSHTSCTLAGAGASASCSVVYTPAQAGSETVAASYAANATFAASQGQTTVTVTKAPTQGGGGGGTGGGGRRVLAHMRLRSIRFAAAGHGCKVEHARRAPASSRTHRDCTHVLVTFAGTIDQHAGGQLISAALTHPVSGRRRPTRVRGRGRVVRGRWTVHVRLPGRNHEPGDRWRFALRYAGDKRLLPAEVDGGFRLEVELKGLPESERTPKPSGRR